jgi:hypothetical protein
MCNRNIILRYKKSNSVVPVDVLNNDVTNLMEQGEQQSLI